jgi:glucosylceramidase
MVTVVMNRSESRIRYKLIVGDSETVLEIEPRAMQSVLY